MIAHDLKSKISLPLESIAELCRRFGVTRLDVFGSVLRDDFQPESDVDFLVSFDGPADLLAFQDFHDELERLIGRRADLLGHKAVEGTPNYLLRRHILSTARPIYAK